MRQSRLASAISTQGNGREVQKAEQLRAQWAKKQAKAQAKAATRVMSAPKPKGVKERSQAQVEQEKERVKKAQAGRAAWKAKILKRDKHTCQRCRSKEGPMVVAFLRHSGEKKEWYTSCARCAKRPL